MKGILEPSKLKVENRQKLILENLDLVHKIARNYSQVFESQYDDLVQVGSIGLINASKRFDPNFNTNFRTYASHLITSEIRHYLRDYLPLVRPPRELQELIPRMRDVQSQLLHMLGREPTEEEIAHQLEIQVSKLEEVRFLEKNVHHLSLNQTLNEQNPSSESILDQLEDKNYQSFQLAQEDRILLNEALMNIRGQSRQVIEFAFYQDLTQTEISKRLGISQMQVSRRLKSALKELWQTLNTRVTPW